MSKFTPDSELDLLFSADLIPSEVRAQLPSDLHVSEKVLDMKTMLNS